MLEQRQGLMGAIRDRFAHVDVCPFEGPRIFFESAGGALRLKSVIETSALYASYPDNQGRDNDASRTLMAAIARGKEDMRLFFNAEDGRCFVGESGTEVLFRLIRNACLSSREGGLMLGSTLEHPASSSAMAHWASATGREHKEIPHDKESGAISVEAYRAALSPDLRVATIIHTSPVTGMSLDVKAIAEAIREVAPDCLIIVDGIQHASHGCVDVSAYGIDGYAISPYKLFSRHGYGVGWASDRLTARPHERLRNGPEDSWELGTRDAGSYATFSDVVAYFDWLGSQFTDSSSARVRLETAAEAIARHEKYLISLLLNGADDVPGLLAMPDVSLIGSPTAQAREGVVSLVVKGRSAASITEALRQRRIRVHIRKNDHYSGNILNPLGYKECLRLSFGHYNSSQEIITLLGALNEIIAANRT